MIQRLASSLVPPPTVLSRMKPTPTIIELHSASEPKPGHASERGASSEAAPYPKGIKLAIIVAFLAASIFLVALVGLCDLGQSFSRDTTLKTSDQDEIIIATAIPQITDDFHSLSDIGWYGSA